MISDCSSVSFLSTPSARRATADKIAYVYKVSISIHALREEGDRQLYPHPDNPRKISIHALREEGDAMSSGFCWKRL